MFVVCEFDIVGVCVCVDLCVVFDVRLYVCVVVRCVCVFLCYSVM